MQGRGGRYGSPPTEDLSPLTSRLCFGPVELRPRERQLLVAGQPVALGARAFDVLLALVAQRGQVVSKADLLDQAWPGLMVEENNLSVQISALRKVLGAHAIATIPALGYRFALAESAADALPMPAAAADTALSQALQGLRQTGPVRLLAEWQAGPDAGPRADPVGPDAEPRADAVGPGASALSDTAFLAQAQRLVAQHGGVWLASPGTGLQAEFASAQAAAACCHLLHPLAQKLLPGSHPPTPQLKAALAEAGPGDVGQALLQRARLGQSLASAWVTQQLVHKLDGDLLDMGPQDAPTGAAPQRFFHLMPSVASMPDERLPTPANKLKPTLAIIPFAAYSHQADPVSLGDILADQVIGALSRSPALHVISRLSTQPFRDRDTPVHAIAQRLAADFVVSGRYWTADGRIHLRVELADADTSQVLWTQALDDLETAVLQPDSALVQQVVGGVVQAVYAHEMAQLRGAALPDLASHTLLLAAINLLYRLSPRDFTLARSALEALHQRAPRHAAPLAWLARWHLFRVVQGWSDNRDEDGRLALDHANHALDLDPDSSLALTMLGNVNTSYLKDLDRADWLYDQALAINPNESLAWLQKGNALSFRGDGPQALDCARRAVSLSPLDPASHFYLTILASAALTARDYPKAIEAASAATSQNQSHLSPHRILAIALAMTGRMDEARANVRRVLMLQPGLTVDHYLAHSPASGQPMAAEFAQALHAAGLPMGLATPGAG